MESNPAISKTEKTQQWLKKHDLPLVCIHCDSPLYQENKNLRCSNGHQFDPAKQGYYFMAKKAPSTKYDRELFTPRRQILAASPFYTALHEYIGNLIKSESQSLADNLLILDAGSGEGSHLAKLTQLISSHHHLVGIDLAKEGVQLATDYNGKMLSLVADLTAIPLADQSTDIILSILSPANYDEFNRILRPKTGKVIKVVPNSDYLIEIRQAMQAFKNHPEKDYSNEAVVDSFYQQFPQAKVTTIKEKVELTLDQRENLAKMTPLTWQLSSEERKTLVSNLPNQITLDISVLQST